MSVPSNVKINRDLLGPAGVEGYLHFVEEIQGDSRGSEQRLADRTQRNFHIRAVLAKSHNQHETIRGGIAQGEGGCFITTPDNLHFESPDGMYEVSRNSKNELSLVSRSIIATNYNEAFEIFLSGLTPALDHLSYLSNTPIVIDIIEGRDEANHITAVSYRTPYENVVLSEGSSNFSRPLIPIYGIYREALNANSNFYRFLCFYKILEGVFNSLRPKLFQLARAQNITITKNKDLVPNDPELRRFQPDYIGRNIHQLFNEIFQGEFRNTVAHFVLADGKVLNPSAHYESNRYASIVFLAQICSREIIQNQENYYKQFFHAGGTL